MRKLQIFFILSFLFTTISAQTGKMVDKVIGIVDDKIILHSDIENQMELLGIKPEEKDLARCDFFDQMLVNRLLVAQAIHDSIPVGEDEVEEELSRKINYYINMAGSQEAFEAYYQKSVDQLKDEFREDIRDQLLAQRMRQEIVGDIQITPSEVRDFFNSIPKDSLPYINTEYEVSQIVVKAQISEEQKQYAYNKLKGLRDRIIGGEDFSTMAILYSEDPGSAENGGELGMAPRGSFVKEFEAVAYKLKKDEISEIVETEYGFHIQQLIERRGDYINVRHILIQPKSLSADLLRSKQILDSVRTKILSDTTKKYTFLTAVNSVSEDDYTKNAGGRMINPQTGGTLIEAGEMDPNVLFVIDTMKVGTISMPILFEEGSTKAYRILRLDSKTPPHIGSLEEDYDKFLNAAKANKQNEVINEWIKKNARKSYILITPEYQNCTNLQTWIQN